MCIRTIFLTYYSFCFLLYMYIVHCIHKYILYVRTMGILQSSCLSSSPSSVVVDFIYTVWSRNGNLTNIFPLFFSPFYCCCLFYIYDGIGAYCYYSCCLAMDTVCIVWLSVLYRMPGATNYCPIIPIAVLVIVFFILLLFPLLV